MKIKILTVGKPSDPNYQRLCADYLGRISHYTPIEHLFVRPPKGGLPVAEILAREEELLLARIGRQEWCVVLDSRGDGCDSLDFSRFLNRQLLGGQKTVLFCLGGAFGLGDKIMQRADQRLSLSRLTMAHELALTVLLEQIYRGFTILRGERYHK